MGAVFLGTPVAAVPSLCALAEVASVDLVITQPDRPVGRSRTPRPPPVKIAAEQFGFPVSQPETHSELAADIAAVGADVALVVAYGRILEAELLNALPLGFLNVHFSLLPKWRGAAPVERAIAAGDTRTGVTLMKIDEGLDTGPVIAERATDIAADDTGGSLTARLAYIGARVVDDTMPEYLVGRRIPVPQIDTGATHAGRLDRTDAEITTQMRADVALRTMRAFTPRPGPWCETAEGPLKIIGFEGTDVQGPAGVISIIDRKVILSLDDGAIQLTAVQPQGKPEMSADAWMNGRRGDPIELVH